MLEYLVRYLPVLRAEVYWYGLALMIRSLVLAMALVVPNFCVQVFLVFVVLLAHLLAMVHLTPWRVQQANFVDGLQQTPRSVLPIDCGPAAEKGKWGKKAVAGKVKS